MCPVFKSGRSWPEEYDLRLNDPSIPKDTMKSWRVGGSEIRVADDSGVMRRRNGEVCCGCGKGHWDCNDDDFDLSKPAFDPYATYETEANAATAVDDGPSLFLGIF